MSPAMGQIDRGHGARQADGSGWLVQGDADEVGLIALQKFRGGFEARRDGPRQQLVNLRWALAKAYSFI